jgi:succinate-semialdehyde dehydrogenase/glutarate-semialdehyde dehydrogenase
MSMLRAINPANEQFVAEYPLHTDGDLDAAIAAASNAVAAWRDTPIAGRCRLLSAAAKVLRERKQEFATHITAEMGKPVRQATAEIEKCAAGCDFYAEHAARLLSPQPVVSDAAKSFVRFDPLGAVLAIMPWNFPFWQVFRCAAPALAAGNVVLLKHASNVPGCALAIEEVFRAAGIPAGVFTTLLVGSAGVAKLVAHPLVACVSLTGSDAAGSAVAEVAGKHLKKCVLELGGSDPFIVLSDADVPHTARQAAAARCQNAGQSCIAAKRFIVEQSVVESFTVEMVSHMSCLSVGDPAKQATDIGPLARGDLRDALHDQVMRSIAAGARVRIGGAIPAGPGFFYPPTLLDRVTQEMPVVAEETFGPVAAVLVARDAEHAIELANDCQFGLGASIWTRDADRAMQLAGRIEAGSVFINEIVKSDPRLPFGGVKRSGYGRELAEFGIREFVNVKSVWVG